MVRKKDYENTFKNKFGWMGTAKRLNLYTYKILLYICIFIKLSLILNKKHVFFQAGGWEISIHLPEETIVSLFLISN